jgi:hypothetical protein
MSPAGIHLATRPDVDARETWQALQSRLTNAHAAVEAGDRARALAEIAAALDIDPDFLAAHSLRDGILAAPDAAQFAPVAPQASATSATAAPSETSAAYPTSGPSASANAYVNFEQRAKRRRVEGRLAAARAALESGHLKTAATALDEVGQLDPTLPELPQLIAKCDDLQRRAAEKHRGPRLVAAAVFLVTLLGASLLHDSTSLISRSMIVAAPLVSVLTPIVTVPPEVDSIGTTGALEPVREQAIQAVIVEPAKVRLSMDPAATAREPAEPEILPEPAPAAVPAPRLLGSVQESPVVAPISMPLPPPSAALADDNLLVKQALQRYRSAYDGLDAQSAHAVWPAVNQAALARAFDGLQSQSLTFDACDVRLRGESATATCQGSARYVPKIGSREPRTEPRVWNFSLHKAGDDWKIESARADR